MTTSTHKTFCRYCHAYCPMEVEVDGGTYSGGRHVRGSGYEKDAEKLNQAAVDGWTVLRFTGRMVKSGQALQTIEAALNEKT